MVFLLFCVLIVRVDSVAGSLPISLDLIPQAPSTCCPVSSIVFPVSHDEGATFLLPGPTVQFNQIYPTDHSTSPLARSYSFVR